MRSNSVGDRRLRAALPRLFQRGTTRTERNAAHSPITGGHSTALYVARSASCGRPYAGLGNRCIQGRVLDRSRDDCWAVHVRGDPCLASLLACLPFRRSSVSNVGSVRYPTSFCNSACYGH